MFICCCKLEGKNKTIIRIIPPKIGKVGGVGKERSGGGGGGGGCV